VNLLNKILAIVLSLIVIYFTYQDSNLTYLLFLIVLSVPFILKLKPIATLIYIVYSFLAMFLGSQVGIYRIVNWYDDIAHILWGFVSGILGIYAIHYFKLNNQKLIFKIFFIFVISLASSVVWEIFEYSCDIIFKSNMQRLETGVEDTMKDMINAFIGNIIFILCYIYELKNKKNLLINKVIGELK